MELDSGDTAWLLASSALVLLMTPGLAFFYGGMVRAKNVLAMLMQNVATIAVVTLTWVLCGFALAFGGGNGLVGNLKLWGLNNLDDGVPGFTGATALTVPPTVFVLFQLMFAIITPALITGATADRWRFASFLPFMALWSILIYAPIAHWVFSPHGWAFKMGSLDFAGGAVVHANAGAAAVAMAIVLGRRRGWPDDPMRPHMLPWTLLGTGLLWFGWFGFNAGSALSAGKLAGTAFLNTQIAASAALLAWIGTERWRFGKATTLGAASGAVCGLVAITPAAGYVSPGSAVIIGLLAGSLCSLLVGLKGWLRLDDSLDVVAVHLGGGVIGALCVGLFATKAVNPAGADGLFYGGGYRLLGLQALTLIAVISYSFVGTLGLGYFLGRLVGNRVRRRDEAAGLDLALHGESAYELGEASLFGVGAKAKGVASGARESNGNGTQPPMATPPGPGYPAPHSAMVPPGVVPQQRPPMPPQRVPGAAATTYGPPGSGNPSSHSGQIGWPS